MQSRIIIFAILICDVIRGSVIPRNNNEYTQLYEYEFKISEGSTTTFQKILSKTRIKVSIFLIILALLIALIINLWPLLRYWCSWLSNGPIAVRIRVTFRIFWQRFVNLFSCFRRCLAIQRTSNEPYVSYNSRQGTTINI